MTTKTRVLPRYIVLKSVYNNKYLQYIKEEEQVGKLLQFSGDEVVSLLAKYQVKKATQKGFVHLRSCYNNKYWVRSAEDQNLIIAGAKELEEDKTKWSCTLFEPIYIDDTTIRFRHVQLGHYLCFWKTTDDLPHNSCLSARSSVPDNSTDRYDVFIINDRELLTILPKYVVFKGDNQKYLTSWTIDRFQHYRFTHEDIGEPMVQYEIFPVGDGSIAIKSIPRNAFLTLGPSGIITSSSAILNTNDPNMFFWPVKVDTNTIALRNVGLKKYCKRDGTGYIYEDSLYCNMQSISKETRLVVQELALAREIYDVEFRLEDARIYKQSILTMATGVATNKTNVENTIDLKLTYSETKSSTWNSNTSLTLGVKTTIETGIPFITDGEIEFSAEVTTSHSWGETNESKKEVETTYHVTVPPMSSVKVSLLATKASCDVPFSYTQRDTFLTDKEPMIYEVDDGLYTGINCFDFTYKTQQIPL